MNNDVQPNTNDCGVYAIAFAVSLAFGKEPAHLHYDNSKTHHLHYDNSKTHHLNCITSSILTEFPSKLESRKNLYIQAHTIPLHCTCRVPESALMFQCTKCQQWFHPDCQDIKLNVRQLKQSRTVKCLEYRSK